MPGSRRSSSTTSGSRSPTLRERLFARVGQTSTAKPRRSQLARRARCRNASSSSTSRIDARCSCGTPAPPARRGRQDDLEGRSRRPARSSTVMSPPQRRTKFSDRNRPSPVPPCRRLKNGSKMRVWLLRRDAAAVVDDADARPDRRRRRRSVTCAAGRARLDGVQQQVDEHVLQLRFVGAHVQAAERGPRLDLHATCARAVGSMSRAPPATVACRSTMSRWRRLAARHPQEVLRDAAAAQDLLARDRRACSPMRASRVPHRRAAAPRAGCPRRRSARWPAACSARGRTRTPAGRATPAGAIPTAALPPRADRRCRARPRRPATSSPAAPRIGEACTSSQRTSPSGVRRSQIRTWRCAASAGTRSVGQSADGADARRRRRGSEQPSTSLARVPGALQKCVVGGDHARGRRRAPRCRRRCC